MIRISPRLPTAFSPTRGWFLSDRRGRDTTTRSHLRRVRPRPAARLSGCVPDGRYEGNTGYCSGNEAPKERRDTCAGDFSSAAHSWDLVLTRMRTPDRLGQIYGGYREAKGSLEPIANALKSIKLLKLSPCTRRKLSSANSLQVGSGELRLSQCALGSQGTQAPRMLQLAADFADLYRGYGINRCRSARCRRTKGNDDSRTYLNRRDRAGRWRNPVSTARTIAICERRALVRRGTAGGELVVRSARGFLRPQSCFLPNSLQGSGRLSISSSKFVPPRRASSTRTSCEKPRAQRL